MAVTIANLLWFIAGVVLGELVILLAIAVCRPDKEGGK